MDTGYVLHRRRYRETSLIVDFLTAAHGRVSAVARGALRGKSSLAAVLQPQLALALELRGRSELQNLIHAEAQAIPVMLQGERLYSLFYINELVMRLTAPHDPNPDLFAAYASTVQALAGGGALEPLLRRFELRLLETIGLGLLLSHDAASGDAIDAGLEYRYLADRGPVLSGVDSHGLSLRGASLLALAEDTEFDAMTLRDAKRLMRYVLDHHLDGRPLASRKLFETGGGRNS